MEESNAIHCVPCMCNNESNSAEGFCIECTEYLCSNCCRDHMKNKITRQHVIVKQPDLPTNIEPYTVMKKLAQCEMHPDNLYEFKCADHEQLICSRCLSRYHRTCQGIEDLCESANVTDKLSGETETLQNLLCFSHELILTFEERGSELVKNNNEIVQACNELAESIKNEVNTINEDTKAHFADIIEKETTEEYINLRRLKDISEIIVTKNEELLEVAKSYGRQHEKAATIKYSREEIQNVQQHIKTESVHVVKGNCISVDAALLSLESRLKMTSNCSDDLNIFIRDVNRTDNGHIQPTNTSSLSGRECTDKLSSQAVSTVCNRQSVLTLDLKHSCVMPKLVTDSSFIEKISDSEDSYEERSSQTETACSVDVDTGDLKPFMMRSVGTHTGFCMKISSDTTQCSLKALALLPSRGIVLLDVANKKIKIASLDLKVISNMKLFDYPSDMCIIIKQVDLVWMCVSFPKAKEVRIFKIKDDVHINHIFTVQTRFYPVSLAGFKNDVIVLSRNNLDEKSTIMQMEQFSAPGKPSTVLINVDDMNDASRIRPGINFSLLMLRGRHVSCIKMHNAKGNIKLGIEQWYYKCHMNRVFKDVTDVTIDKEGNKYICAKDSNSVHQVSYSCFSKNRIIIDSINTPTCIVVDSNGDRIILGYEKDDNLYEYPFV
ncbi:uncharacterized protein LOC127835030 [Dreissena polymorpha]|uniref:uncharacterized protein LOC127835030 n=1 Tax=Dreissena polymorpha TaxID=45954 RepID=UPI002264B85A|nr:uncharacterized protein LOC127835030 [Dreissena polymorpha]